MITKKEPNYLNLLGERQLELLPPSFNVISVPFTYNTHESIARWIYENCKGRFYVGRGIEIVNGSVESVVKIGFENPKESSYFVLACPYLKYH